MLLDPNDVASAIVQKLLIDNSAENMLLFVKKQEWNIYTDFPEFIGKDSV